MKTVMSSKGQIVLPAGLPPRPDAPGQQFEIERLEEGQYLLKKQEPTANAGLVDWLLSCPVKDWFTPMPSESTDSL